MGQSEDRDTLIEPVSRNSYCVRGQPDSISLEIEDAGEDWAASDFMIKRADEEGIQFDKPFATKVGSAGTIGELVVVDEDIMIRHALPLTEAPRAR